MENLPIEPRTNECEVRLTWNFDEIKNNLDAALEKYGGLVVTDANVRDMERARREVGAYRTGIQKFRTAVKKKMKEPVDAFSRQCDELLGIVAEVETPIQKQLDVYENRRIENVTRAIEEKFESEAREAGLREEYWSGFSVRDQYLNRTWKWADTLSDIAHYIREAAQRQEADDARAAMIAERRDMAEAEIARLNEQYGLANRLTKAILTDEILALPMPGIRSRLEAEAAHRKKIEDDVRAAVLAKASASAAANAYAASTVNAKLEPVSTEVRREDSADDKKERAWASRVAEFKAGVEPEETVITVRFHIKNDREGVYVQKHLDQIQEHVQIEILPEA